MKVKASITLSSTTLRAVDRLAKKGLSRSAIIEAAVLEYLVRSERARRDARDLEIINASADDLNRAMEGVLADQVDL
ncbi:MAG TPA: ribbon-helix-helix protein, CopG family [Kofleriaceae bacterium]|nr:ribbon-helix-helix protein, CopG family [Kofleriaceae bacterium]